MEEAWGEALAQLERVWPRVAGTAGETAPARPAPAADPIAAQRCAAACLLAAAECGGRAAAGLRAMASDCAAGARRLAAEEFLRSGTLPEAGAPPRPEGGPALRLRAAYLALLRAEAACAAVNGPPERCALCAAVAAENRACRQRIFALVAGLMK